MLACALLKGMMGYGGPDLNPKSLALPPQFNYLDLLNNLQINQTLQENKASCCHFAVKKINKSVLGPLFCHVV